VSRKERIGFIGLGDIGQPMAMRVADAGWPIRVYNRTAARLAPFVDRGVDIAANPAELARACDIVFTCVSDGDAVEQVVFGPEGVAAGARPGQLLVDLSTIHPYAARDMARRLMQVSGMAWVDSPVSGGSMGARAGTLAVMAGGAAADVERARPVLMSFAGKVTHMGPTGCGNATKACNQMIGFCNAAAIAETLSFAAKFDIDPLLIPDALAGGFADSNVLRLFGKAMAEGTYSGDGAMGVKDINIALDLGRQTGSAMPLTGLVASIFQLLVSQGFTTGGLATPMRLYAQGPLTTSRSATDATQ
jgi:3-hydroxyisobutyrate dehydrogenase